MSMILIIMSNKVADLVLYYFHWVFFYWFLPHWRSGKCVLIFSARRKWASDDICIQYFVMKVQSIKVSSNRFSIYTCKCNQLYHCFDDFTRNRRAFELDFLMTTAGYFKHCLRLYLRTCAKILEKCSTAVQTA